MCDQLSVNQIILASASPRRRRLLAKAGLAFDVIPSLIDESRFEDLPPEVQAKSLAEAKASVVAEMHPRKWVIGADSIVVIDGKILNKPASPADAKRMLSLLSGRTHQVLTGYSIICNDRQHRFTDCGTTRVTFKTLAASEIEWYLQTPEPYDKAGAYAIQGIGAFMVKTIHGSYTNVVGLPLCEVVDHLLQNKVIERTVAPAEFESEIKAAGAQ